jgi:hypothetical protein
VSISAERIVEKTIPLIINRSKEDNVDGFARSGCPVAAKSTAISTSAAITGSSATRV